MKSKFLTGIAATAMLFTVLALPLFSEDEGSDKGGDAAADDPMKPGPEHAALAKLAGKWDVASKFYDMEGKATDSKGSAEFKVIFDGRYVQQDYKGEMEGTTFTGLEIIGFDRVSKKYTAHWIDSMSTGAVWLTGTSKDAGKTIEFTGKMSDPSSGGEIESRWVHTHKGDDSFVFEMFLKLGDKEVKFMELTYTRKK
ncbi:MAG: DUF1579 domain-containing protein [Planctomycetota bacterium]